MDSKRSQCMIILESQIFLIDGSLTCRLWSVCVFTASECLTLCFILTVEDMNKLLFSLNRNLETLPWKSKVGGLSCYSLHMRTELGVARDVY